MTKRRFDYFLKDIVRSIDRIQEYLQGQDFETFMDNYMIQDAVVRNFEIIGEATKGIPEEVKKKYSKVPWKNMYGLRNIISHQYFGVDYQTLWEIAKNELPNNKIDLIEVIKKEGF